MHCRDINCAQVGYNNNSCTVVYLRFIPKLNFEKLMHLVGFIVRMQGHLQVGL